VQAVVALRMGQAVDEVEPQQLQASMVEVAARGTAEAGTDSVEMGSRVAIAEAGRILAGRKLSAARPRMER
jgi:hypothetical protein